MSMNRCPMIQTFSATSFGDAMNQPRLVDFTASNDGDKYRDTDALLHDFSAFENNLVNLSAGLLAILTTLSQQKDPQNLPELHQFLLSSMSELHNRGLQAGYAPRFMEKACYVLCAAFDEEIMNTAWGQAACWENHSLVAQLFQQRNAGEVFFTLLDQARQNIPRMIDFIELQYLLLRLGFCGRYQETDKHALADLLGALYHEINQHRKPVQLSPPPLLDKPWRPLKQRRLWRLYPLVFLILLLFGIATHFWIQHINNLYDDDLQWLHQPAAQTSADKVRTGL